MSPTAVDRAFQALADPTRRAIVERLMRAPQSVSDLAAPMGMSLPAIGHHLRVLESRGLIRTVKSGRVRTCTIDSSAMRNVERWITARRADWERRLDGLDRFLAERAGKDS